MITGNKGEWSELYVLLKLLADGKLYSADADLRRLPDVWSPLLRIFRKEIESESMEYRLNSQRHTIELYINGDKIKSVDSEWLKEAAETIYNGILSGGQAAFPISGSDVIMNRMNCTKIKAKSSDKTDISMQIRDTFTGHDRICGFSIKSDLGKAPSLLNASKQTNFVYEIKGLDESFVDMINSINTGNKIIDRIARIKELGGSFSFVKMDSETFRNNVRYIDSFMDVILGRLLLPYYEEGMSRLTDAVTKIEEEDPLGFGCSGIYRYKVKKFLSAIALGMVPSKQWDGRDEANGGYIIVKSDGNIVAYHLYNRDSFETYLLNNTRFERGDTARHNFASLYKEVQENGENRILINFNLQIRFK